jgi:ubiquinone/menaquinone biosynthesis C-methylase UbiE
MSSSPAPATTPNPARILGTLFAYQDTAALKAAIDIGLFTAIAEGASTPAAIAEKCGAAERGVRILCDFLVTSEMLEKTAGGYANTLNSGVFLNRHSPAYLGGVAEFLVDPMLTHATLHDATAAVRKGGTMLPGKGSVNPDNPFWVTFARAMAPMTVPAAHAIAEHLPAAGPVKVLDIAAGHGTFGIAIAQRNKDAQITALDWAAVLEVAKENAAKAGVTDRYSTLPGDFFTAELAPEEYDAILITNFLHHFDTPTCEGIFRKVHAALKPGGVAITLEFVPNEDRVTPPGPARFPFTMLITTQAGDAYTFAEYEAMLHKTGFASNAIRMLESQHSVIISTK